MKTYKIIKAFEDAEALKNSIIVEEGPYDKDTSKSDVYLDPDFD